MGIKQVEIQAKDKKPVCHNNALTIKHLSLRGHDEFRIALVTYETSFVAMQIECETPR